MPAKNRVVALLKFGNNVHMEALVRDGELYLQPLSRFIAMEADCLRADPNEALYASLAARGGSLAVEENGHWRTLGEITSPLRVRDESLETANVFCAHILLATRCQQSPNELIDLRNLKFGDTFVIFTDTDEFMRRVRAQAARLERQLESDAVVYVDQHSYWGDMGLFRKYSEYAYQSEYRIAIRPGTGTPYTLKLGNLSDITSIGKLSEVNQRLSWTAEGRLVVRH